jgi:starvation-inducible DNA-binding protein
MKIEIGIDEARRQEIAFALSRLFGDTYALYLKTQSFHWNVIGPMFQTLHLMFEEQYRELAEALDTIAERIRALGSPAPGSFSELARLSSIAETKDVPRAQEMILLLLHGNEATARTARSILPHAAEAHDEVTTDLLIERLGVHEKRAWMLRSLLEV